MKQKNKTKEEEGYSIKKHLVKAGEMVKQLRVCIDLPEVLSTQQQQGGSQQSVMGSNTLLWYV